MESDMSGSYTKNDLVKEIATNARISRRRVDMLLTDLTAIAYREAVNGFTIPGICKLDIVRRKERRARNPQTGDILLIGEHDVLRVRPLKRAKATVTPTPENLVTVLPPEPQPEQPVAPASAGAGWPAAASPAPARAPTESEFFSFKCPYCRAAIEVTSDCAGDRISCPACNKRFTVPEVGQAAVAANEPAAKAAPAAAPAPSSESYVSFLCKACSQEIEAPIDMAGSQAECPACGSVMVIPYVSEPNTTQAVRDTVDDQTFEAYKSRTIRIELPDDV